MTRASFTRRGFLASSAALASLAGVSPSRAQVADGRLRIRSRYVLEILDPMTRTSVSEGEVMDCLFPGLVTFKIGDEFGYSLDAAESFEVLDETHFRFALRPDVGWSNGFGPMTAEDVKFSFERIADPANESPYRNDWDALDHVEVADARSGMIVLKRPFIPLLSTTLPALSGMIVCKAAVEALEGRRFTMNPPAVAGPYEIAEMVDRQSITLRRRADYAGPPPAFETVHFLSVEDSGSAEIAYAADELDCTQVQVTSVPRLRRSLPEDSALLTKPALDYMWLGMQMEEGVFADKRVRQAVQYALNVQDVIDGAFFGEAARATGLVAPGILGHRQANLIPEPDLDKARALLAEAGMPNGFRTDIKVRNSTEFVNVGQVVSASLAQVGIEVEVIPLDSAVLRNYGAGPNGEWRQMAMYVTRFSMNPDPAWATEWFTTGQIGDWNYSRFSNEEYDRLHVEATAVTDEARRAEMYVRMQDLMEESGAFVFLVHGINAVLHKKTIDVAFTADAARAKARNFTLAG